MSDMGIGADEVEQVSSLNTDLRDCGKCGGAMRKHSNPTKDRDGELEYGLAFCESCNYRRFWDVCKTS